MNTFSCCAKSLLCWINTVPIKPVSHIHKRLPLRLSVSNTHTNTKKTTTLGCRSLNREHWVTDNSSKIFLMRHLPGCRTVNSPVDSAEQLDSLQLSRGCGHIQSNTGSENIHGFFFTCQIVIDVIKQKLGLKKKAFMLLRRILPPISVTCRRELHNTKKACIFNNNMATC